MCLHLVPHGALLDTLNLEGVRLTYPLWAPDYCYVLPGDERLRIKQGSAKERMVQIVCALICLGLLGLNLAGERTVFRNILGTPEAIARDYVHQLKQGYRPVVRISGIWTNKQFWVDSEFDVVAATDGVIFVRHGSLRSRGVRDVPYWYVYERPLGQKPEPVVVETEAVVYESRKPMNIWRKLRNAIVGVRFG
jgi:hypothetical protein